MTPLQNAIANLYKVFSTYNESGMQYCDCGCIDQEDVHRLGAAPLSELSEEVLARYHVSALFTWGTLTHYKHYLPRILELYTHKRKDALVDLYDIGHKLADADWPAWPHGEVQALKDFVMADWMDFANNNISQIVESDFENYTQFFPLETLLQNWRISQSDIAFRNFVPFIYTYGNKLLSSRFTLNGQDVSSELIKWIDCKELTLRLQEAFFIQEPTDKDFAEQVSVVLQMIEQAFQQK